MGSLLFVVAIVLSLAIDVAHCGAHWDYVHDDKNGVLDWGDEFPDCNGQHQSPINIDTSKVKINHNLTLELGGIDISHEAWLQNNGHTAQVQLLDTPKPNLTGTVLDNKVYEFAQLHFHWGRKADRGSEHSIDSDFSAGEVHIVFYRREYGDMQTAQNYKDGLTVLGIFLESARKINRDYEPLIAAVRKSDLYMEKSFVPSPITVHQLLPKDSSRFYHYHGSLTTPPCSEAVNWILLADPVYLSEKQFKALRNEKTQPDGSKKKNIRLDHNYRYQNPLNDRVVDASFDL